VPQCVWLERVYEIRISWVGSISARLKSVIYFDVAIWILVDDYIAVHITFLCSLPLAYEQWKSLNRSFHSYSNDINFVSKILDGHEKKTPANRPYFLPFFWGKPLKRL